MDRYRKIGYLSSAVAGLGVLGLGLKIRDAARATNELGTLIDSFGEQLPPEVFEQLGKIELVSYDSNFLFTIGASAFVTLSFAHLAYTYFKMSK